MSEEQRAAQWAEDCADDILAELAQDGVGLADVGNSRQLKEAIVSNIRTLLAQAAAEQQRLEQERGEYHDKVIGLKLELSQAKRDVLLANARVAGMRQAAAQIAERGHTTAFIPRDIRALPDSAADAALEKLVGERTRELVEALEALVLPPRCHEPCNEVGDGCPLCEGRKLLAAHRAKQPKEDEHAR